MAYTPVLLLQVDRLEQDALEVLSLIRSVKNKLAPISRIPGAVLSLIPNYWERQYIDTDKDLVTLTHVCRGWREVFTSHPSLWTRLDFTNIEKPIPTSNVPDRYLWRSPSAIPRPNPLSRKLSFWQSHISGDSSPSRLSEPQIPSRILPNT